MTTLTLSPKVSVTSRVEDLLWQGGLIIIAFLPVTFLVSLYDPRQLNEINIWSKPMKFYASVGLHMITIAFIARFIDYDVRRKFSVYVLGWVLTFTAIFELAYLTMQAARGRHSHWNFETTFESLGLRLGILLGMILGFFTTLIVAGYMSQTYGHWVGGVQSDADGLPIVGWVRSGGDLRVPHFFATHLMQIIPVIGFIADRFSQRPRLIVVIASTIGVGMVAFTFLQALRGQPFI